RRRTGRRDPATAGQGGRDHDEQRVVARAVPPPGGQPAFTPAEAERMSQTCAPSTLRRYGLARVCRGWELARSTGYLDQAGRAGPVAVPRKRGPKPRWSDGELLAEIRAVLEAAPFLGEGHRKVWARLRGQGVRTSKARVLRLMREAKLLAPTRAGHAHG